MSEQNRYYLGQYRTQRVKVRKGVDVVHIETDLGIVNIHLGLADDSGHAVESVSMIPDSYAGERRVTVQGGRFVRETDDEKNTRLGIVDDDNPPEGWEECGCCGCWHPGDGKAYECRDDAHRWPFAHA